MTFGGNHIEHFLASKVRGAETGRIPNIVTWGNYIYAMKERAIYLGEHQGHLNSESGRDGCLKVY